MNLRGRQQNVRWYGNVGVVIISPHAVFRSMSLTQSKLLMLWKLMTEKGRGVYADTSDREQDPMVGTTQSIVHVAMLMVFA